VYDRRKQLPDDKTDTIYARENNVVGLNKRDNLTLLQSKRVTVF